MRGPQLIAYGDRLAGDLAGLRHLLDGDLAGAFAGVHVLPFYEPIDGADAGFDPADHTAVDARLGTWDDVGALAGGYDVVADVIANHVSVRSAPFRDWQRRGPASRYDGMFLTLAGVFPGGATEADLALVYRPRPGLCFTPMAVAGRTRLVWTTFTPEQVDLDVDHPEAAAYLTAILDRLAAAGVRAVRLDAIGYAVKRPGTTSFMIDETYRFIERLGAECAARGLEVLVEVHGHHGVARRLAPLVDWVYDFATPPLLLHALTTADAAPLRRWIATRPANSVVVLDTHDGINLTDVGPDPADPSRAGLLDPAQVAALVEALHERTGGTSREPTGAPVGGRGLYQVNTTFFDAVGRDERAYLLCRAVQVFLPGVPQVYYVGLLAGGNDVERFARTGVGRDVNRHHYTPGELRAALAQPVVGALLALLRWRALSPVFAGSFHAEPAGAGAGTVVLRWSTGADIATLRADLAAGDFAIELTSAGCTTTVRDLTALPA